MATPSIQQLVAHNATREQIEEWCRLRTQHYPIAVDAATGEKAVTSHYVVGRVLGKFLMYVVARDSALTPHLMLDGIWEPWITMAIARHVRPGMRCMDVGACYGYYSLLMADIVGTEGAVEAWEPVWADAVRTNASVNGLPIKVRGALLGTNTQDQYRRLIPQGCLFNAGDVPLEKHVEGTRYAGWSDWISVSKPDQEPWDFIKIDVEGAEADVWRALTDVREMSPSLTVCMEFTPKKHAEPRAFLEQINIDGFALGTVGHDGWPRPVTIDEALVPDTGDFRMLWLKRWP
jgi:FkbM family methyltransferase